jgi:hypothetical protein
VQAATLHKVALSPKAHMLDGFVAAGKPVIGAAVTLTARSGGRVATTGAAPATGLGGYFSAALAHGPRPYVVVSATGGRIGGRLFAGTLTAAVARFRPGMFVHVNPVTTLVAAYAKTHPSAGLTVSGRRVDRFLGVPALPSFAFDQPTPDFDGNLFLARAQAAGGVDRYVAKLVRKMDNLDARVTFRGASANGVVDTVAGVILARLLTAVLDKACASGGGLENFLKIVGQCPKQDENAVITGQLNLITQRLGALSSAMEKLEGELTNTNWNVVFSPSDSIRADIPIAYGQLAAMQAAVGAMGNQSPSTCPPPDNDNTPCDSYIANHSAFLLIEGQLEDSSDVIFSGLTGAAGGGISDTFLGAQQATIGGNLTPPYPTKPLFGSANVQSLVDIQNTMRDAQAMQYDIIITERSANLDTTCGAPVLTATPPGPPTDACDWANQFVYYLSEEEEPQLVVSPLPADLLVDTRPGGMLWSIYPLQTCDTFLGASICGQNDIPNPNPNYSVTVSPRSQSPACPAQSPAAQWDDLPGSCVHAWSAEVSPLLCACVISVGVFIGPTVYTSFDAPGTLILMASWAQEMSLLDGWPHFGSLAAFLQKQGFQDVEVPNGPWSWLTEPGTGYNADLLQGYSTGCTTYGDPFGTVFYPGGGSCFGQWDFGLQSGWAPPGMQFILTPQDIANVPVPTVLAPGP